MKARSTWIFTSTIGRYGAIKAMELSNLTAIPVAGFQAKRASGLQQDYLLVPDSDSHPPLRRLVVVVPPGEFDEQKLGLRVGKLAFPGRLSILFLALATNPEVDCSLRRRLVTLTSLVKDSQIRISAKLTYHENWVQAVEEIRQEGDLLVCLERNQAATLFSPRTELAPYLVSALGIPAYVLTGIHITRGSTQWDKWRDLLVWVASIAVIVLFGLLQAFVERNLQGFVSTIILILSIIPEVLLLLKLNLSE
jgi:hypothetical protein